jgi:hypothetical protein
MRRGRLAALAVLVLVASSCGVVGSGSDDGAGRPLVVVLFDVSRSTQADGVREGYLAAFDRVLDFAEANEARVVGDVIDENPLAHSTYPVDGAFEGCDAFSENRLTCDGRTAKLRQDLTGTAAALLEPVERPSGTDVHGGVLVAARVFDAYPEAGERYLVVLSDMVERAAWGDEEPVVAPDLAGVSVYVVGAGASGGAMSAHRILEIQRSWQRYFEATGAELSADRYGAALVRFP